jgi:hypothetical protein
MMGEELPAADFFDFESLLSVQEQRKLKELRAFLDTEIAPYAGQWWDRAEFPAHILPKLAALRLSAPAQRGYTHLFAGLGFTTISLSSPSTTSAVTPNRTATSTMPPTSAPPVPLP